MSEIVVKVNEGFLRGKITTNYKSGKFYSFFGIPYALPPLGQLRFQYPQPPQKWNGIKDATQEKEGCISRNIFTKKIEGGEDCLFLNVFSSMVPSKNGVPKPVMVWVHGGSFYSGSTKTDLYGPEYLLTEDIVLVTVSFRLGALGFLCLEDASLGVTGNNGLRDVIMALRWVHTNIPVFLGDANNVTLFGESSGATMCHFLMLSPLTKGLFHKIILQSACALNFWAVGSTHSATEMGKNLDLPFKSDRELLKLLQQLSVEKLYEAQEKTKVYMSPHAKRDFFPVLEAASRTGEQAVIVEDPVEIIRSGNYIKMPMMIGYTSAEGQFFDYRIRQTLKSKGNNSVLIKDFEDLVPHPLKISRGTPLSKYIANEIKSFYFKGEDPTPTDRAEFYDLHADLYFNHRLFTAANMHLENMDYPIYYFRFSVDGSFNFYKKLHGADFPGASHSDDVCYLFKLGNRANDIIENSIEDVTIQRMVKFWTNFARFGNPNVEILDKKFSVRWNPIEKGKFQFLDIGKELAIDTNPDYERMQFWNNIYKLYPAMGKL